MLGDFVQKLMTGGRTQSGRQPERYSADRQFRDFGAGETFYFAGAKGRGIASGDWRGPGCAMH